MPALFGEGVHIGFLASGEDQSATGGLSGQSSSGQFLFQKPSTAADLTCLHCSTGNEVTIGVLMNKPKTGEAADIQNNGVGPVMYGGTITHGQQVEIDSSGRAVASTTSGHVVVGQALESGNLGEIHSIVIYNSPYPHP